MFNKVIVRANGQYRFLRNTIQCRLVKKLNVKDTFRLVFNCGDLSFLIRVNP